MSIIIFKQITEHKQMNKPKKSIDNSNSFDMKKKAALLKEKILTNATITHNTYQYRIDELSRQQQHTRNKLNQMIDNLSKQFDEIGKKYEKQMQKLHSYYIDSKVTDTTFAQAIQAQQLKRYLNTEKSALKQLLELQSQEKSMSEQNKLHNLVKSKQLQELLQQVQIKQLEKQVKYLSTHVINSSGIIYTPENTITEADQQEINAKVQMLLSEVSRLVSLEIVCSSSDQATTQSKANNMDKVLNGLSAQQKRLNTVFEMLNAEKQAVSFIQNQLSHYIDIVKHTPTYVPNASKKSINTSRSVMALKSPQNQQIQRILSEFNLEQYADIVSSRKCSLQEYSTQLKSLRSRLMKMQ